MKRTAHRAFTLVEIMIVIAIIAILASLAIPSYLAYRKTAHAKACVQNMHEIKSALLTYQMNHGGTYTTDLSKLISAGGTGLLREELTCPAGGTYTITYNTSTQLFEIECSEADEENHNVEGAE